MCRLTDVSSSSTTNARWGANAGPPFTLEDGEVTDRPLPLAKRCSVFAEQMRTWPGFEVDGTVTGNWYRFTTRDFETFARMVPWDRYPQALRSVWQRFQEALRERAALGAELVPGSSAYDALKDRLIPPYRNDAFDEGASCSPTSPPGQ